MLKHTLISTLLPAVLLISFYLSAGEKPTERTENCTTEECHNSYGQQQYVHKPVARGVCKFCHDLVDPEEHSFRLFRTGRELCGACHEEQTRDLITIPSLGQFKPKAQLGKSKYLHEPMEDGNCTDCHDPHSSDNEFLVSSANLADLCRECHEINEHAKNPHEPVADGDCNKCHNSHGSDYHFLLIDSQRQLCLSCHEDTKAELERFKYIHPSVLDRGCSECHEPHGSDYFRLLIKRYVPEFYAPFDVSNYDLCFSCHREDKVLIDKTEILTEFRNGTTNLHYLHVNLPERGRTCRTCHATHASNEPRHLRKNVPYGGWEIPIQFEQTSTGGGCAPGCHDHRLYDRIKPIIYTPDNNP